MKRTVNVVFKTHLDIGFTHLAKEVVARYMKDYIPAALALAKKSRSDPNRFVWTTGSWLAYRFLADADRAGREMMEEAIIEGDFHWHALPFTTHTELMDPGLFRLGLEFSRRLDHRFGRKTLAAKMTDVPGHTLGMVPLLAEAGVRLLHIGVNPTSIVPDVPPIFIWRSGRAEIIVIYDKVYGATTELPSGDYLSMNLTGDNLGPQNPGEIGKVYKALRRRFPEATVQAGSLNPIAQAAWKKRRQLPVVTSEIGDSWIHGVGTDPQKVSRFRELSRLRLEWIEAGLLSERGEVDLAFGEKLLLVAEHTWGLDLKTHLKDKKIWKPLQLKRALQDKPNFRAVTESWQEQRSYIDKALIALPARLRTQAKTRLVKMTGTPWRSAGHPLAIGQIFFLGGWEVALNSTGAITWLKKGNQIYADRSHHLGALTYQTFSPADYHRFYRGYCRLKLDWCLQDFTKPGMTGSISFRHQPLIRKMELSAKNEAARVWLGFSAAARRMGAPDEMTVEISAQEKGIDLRLDWEGKPANRLPEAFWLRFNPLLKQPNWRLEKLGLKIDPAQVVKDGNRHLHAVPGLVTSGAFSLNSLDAVLIAPGVPRLLDFTNQRARLDQGITSVLYNNLWGTNFPMWYSDGASFRYECRWDKER